MRRPFIATLITAGAALAAVEAVSQQSEAPAPPAADGCWVSVFDGRNFAAPSARLGGFASGAARELDLRDANGQDFVGRIDSIVVGPNAEVVARHPAGVELLLKPGTRIADLDVVNFRNRIDSLRVRCVDEGEAARLQPASAPSRRGVPPLFTSLDRNRDGFLDRSELAAPGALMGDWIVMDRNGDGLISPDEFSAVTAQK